MVVDHVREIVCREPVRLDQDHVVQFIVWHCDIPVDLVMEGRLSLIRDIQADDPRFSRRQVCLDLFPAQSQAVLVIDNDIRAVIRHRSFQRFQSFFVAEAVIRIALLHELLRILQVQAGSLPLALYIGAAASVFIRALIMLQPGLLQCPVYDVQSSLHETLLVRILHTEDEVSSLVLCDQIRVERCP